MKLDQLSEEYRAALRTLLRFAIVLAAIGLLAGIAFQESARKLPFAAAGAGLHLEAIHTLALVHGHVFLMGVLLPLALAAALPLALAAGGRPLARRDLAWLTRIYLPFAAASLALQLVKGSHALRYGLYGLLHAGMGLGLGLFLLALWRSLESRAPRR